MLFRNILYSSNNCLIFCSSIGCIEDDELGVFRSSGSCCDLIGAYRDWYNDGGSFSVDKMNAVIIVLKISSETVHSEGSTGGEFVVWGTEETSPSEEAILSDVIVACDIGVMEGVLSCFNSSAIFINAFFVELCAPGRNVDCLLCNKCTISSAVWRKCLSSDACGIGICCGIMVAVSIIFSRCVLGI